MSMKFHFDSFSNTRFTDGGCQDLAAEFHERFDLPIIVFKDACSKYESPVFHHFVSRLSDGRVIDIMGVHDVDDLISQWEETLGTNIVAVELSEDEQREVVHRLNISRVEDGDHIVVQDIDEFDSCDFVDPAPYADAIAKILSQSSLSRMMCDQNNIR